MNKYFSNFKLINNKSDINLSYLDTDDIDNCWNQMENIRIGTGRNDQIWKQLEYKKYVYVLGIMPYDACIELYCGIILTAFKGSYIIMEIEYVNDNISIKSKSCSILTLR